MSSNLNRGPVNELVIRKFFPTVEECKVNNLVECTEKSCLKVFSSESNLTMHLAKTHKQQSHLLKADRFIKQFHCPNSLCIYNADRHFKNLKCLRQHYLKVHEVKQFACLFCQQSYPSENMLEKHNVFCGVNFKCCDCEISYACYETLKTHGRRKKHTVLAKAEYKSKGSESATDVAIPMQKDRPILPKSCLIFVPLPVKKVTCDRECQTISAKQIREADMLEASQQTQNLTGSNQFSVATQTNENFMSVNRNKLLSELLDQKSSNTQTDSVESRSTSCNTSFNFNDFEFSDPVTSSSSTQTRTHDSIYTDTSDLLADETLTNPINNFEFDNCHMETQTDFMFENEMFSCDYLMSNMYTQTCDIFNQFGFNDIQTQTVFDDMLRSVESQTMAPLGIKGNSRDKDISHTETQTDVEFRQMLEVINS